MTCPPLPSTEFDLRNANCVEVLNGMFQAYMALVAGRNRIVLRYNERWVEYQKGDMEALRTTYQILFNQCPQAVAAGLPSLNTALQSRRGPPLRGFSNFGRL